MATLRQAIEQWEKASREARAQATLALANGEGATAAWHMEHARRCTHIAERLRIEKQRLSESPDDLVAIRAGEILRDMLTAEELGLKNWDDEENTWR